MSEKELIVVWFNDFGHRELAGIYETKEKALIDFPALENGYNNLEFEKIKLNTKDYEGIEK